MLAGLKDVPALPGIYAIVNTRNGKRYVGSSVNMRERLKRHTKMLGDGAHWNVYLSRAWAKHGPEAFDVQAMEVAEDAAMLRAREQAFIDAFDAANRAHGYNASPTAERPTHTAETRERISAAGRGRKLSDAHRAALRESTKSPERVAHLVRMQEARKGCKHSAETRERISAMQRGKPGRKRPQSEIDALAEGNRGSKRSDEARARMSAAAKARPPRVQPPEELEAMRERLRAAAAARRGSKSSAETRARISASLTGLKRPNAKKRGPMSEETRAKIRATKRRCLTARSRGD